MKDCLIEQFFFRNLWISYFCSCQKLDNVVKRKPRIWWKFDWGSPSLKPTLRHWTPEFHFLKVSEKAKSLWVKVGTRQILSTWFFFKNNLVWWKEVVKSIASLTPLCKPLSQAKMKESTRWVTFDQSQTHIFKNKWKNMRSNFH